MGKGEIKCIAEINITADSKLEAIFKLEKFLEDCDSFDVKSCIAFTDFIDIRYGAKIDG